MADKPAEKKSYIQQVGHFYLAPGLRSIATVFYLGVYGFFTIYHIHNIFLAIRFLFYVIVNDTALQGTAFLFMGMAFVVSMVFPFAVSLYSIFILHKIWESDTWAPHVKWAITAGAIAASILLIIVSDNAARITANSAVMQSFVEDANLTGRI